ncbi:MAG TPA: AI-2E family transporter [Sphingomonas sp.]|nr:AI-2E family transporter [Sphingomonas sp.]
MNEPTRGRTNQRSFLLLLLVVATIGFAWLIGPFAGAILWGIIAAILFTPIYERLLDTIKGRRNVAAVLTLLIIVALVIVPALLLGAALLNQAASAYAAVRSGEIDLGRTFVEMETHLPGWARTWLESVGLNDLEGVRARLAKGFSNSFQTVVAQLFNAGQSAFGFFLALGVMLYLTFFLLRDGRMLTMRLKNSIPLPVHQRDALLDRFVAVVRATIKGSLIVAILQGAIGGVLFWVLGIRGALLWGVAMGVFSLFPAVGTGLVWVPVTIYLLVTGAIWQGVALGLCGFLIISSVDNVVRPILVGRETRMPDYVVLISTLGGFELMGFNGFVIGPVIAALFLAVWTIYIEAQGARA